MIVDGELIAVNARLAAAPWVMLMERPPALRLSPHDCVRDAWLSPRYRGLMGVSRGVSADSSRPLTDVVR